MLHARLWIRILSSRVQLDISLEYRVEHSKIKFVSTCGDVISSMYPTAQHAQITSHHESTVSYLLAYYKSSTEFATLCGYIRCILSLSGRLRKERSYTFVRNSLSDTYGDNRWFLPALWRPILAQRFYHIL